MKRKQKATGGGTAWPRVEGNPEQQTRAGGVSGAIPPRGINRLENLIPVSDLILEAPSLARSVCPPRTWMDPTLNTLSQTNTGNVLTQKQDEIYFMLFFP